MVRIREIFILCWLCLPIILRAQSSVLDQEVTALFSPVSKYEALKTLERDLGIFFSYRADLLQSDELIQVPYRNTTLQFILDEIFNNNKLEYIVEGKIIIIKLCRQTAPEQTLSDPKDLNIELTLESCKSELQEMDFLPLESIDIDSIEYNRAIDHLPPFNSCISIRKNNELNADHLTDFGKIVLPKANYSSYSILSLSKSNKRYSLLNIGNQDNCVAEKLYGDDNYVPGCTFSERNFTYHSGISISPHLSFGEGKTLKPGIQAGIKQDIWFRHILAVSLGLQLSVQKVSIPDKEEGSPDLIEEKLIHYGIPLNIYLSLISDKTSSVYINGGMYNYIFSMEGIPDGNKKLEWLKYINLGIGFEIKFRSKYIWQTEPYYRFPVGSNPGYGQLNKVGINIGFMYCY